MDEYKFRTKLLAVDFYYVQDQFLSGVELVQVQS